MRKEIVSKLEDGRLYILFHNSMYEPEAIRSAVYKFTDRCHALIQPADEWETAVIFEPVNEEVDLSLVAKDFTNEALDQQIRRDLEKRFGNVRDLIVKQAFSPVVNISGELCEDD